MPRHATDVSVLARWWPLLKPPVVGVATVVLLGIAAGVIIGHAGIWQKADARGDQDFLIFLASARHASAGRSLYTPTWRRSVTSSRLVTGAPNLNLPHTLVPLLPLAYVPSAVALAIWMAGSLAAGVWCLWATLRAVRWRPAWLTALAVGVYVLAWAPSAAFTLTAQLSFFVALPVCLGWLADRNRRSAAAGAWLGVAAAMKPFLLLLVPYFVLRRDWRATWTCLIAVTAIVSVGLAVFGPSAYVEWARQLPRVSWAGHYLNASWLSLVQRAFGDTVFAPVAQWPWFVAPLALAGTSVIGAVTFLRLRLPTSAPADVDRDWTCLLLAALLMSPLGWVYYLWIAAWPLAATLAARAPWRTPLRRDLWLIPGMAGWLWLGQMTGWGQPHPLATLTLASAYFWALFSLWMWACSRQRPVHH